MTTNAIDHAIHEYILSHKAYPSPLTYLGFPRSCCTSVNNVIVHGIPDEYDFILLRNGQLSDVAVHSRPLEDGDIVNIDITVYLDGYHGDTSRTFLVGIFVSPCSLSLRHHISLLTFNYFRISKGETLSI